MIHPSAFSLHPSGRSPGYRIAHRLRRTRLFNRLTHSKSRTGSNLYKIAICASAFVLVGAPRPAEAQLFGNKADLFLQQDAGALPAATSENVIVQLSAAPNLSILSQI